MAIDVLSSIPPNRKIETERTVNYAPEQIFGAFRNPDLLSKWWGPNGFTNTFEIFEFKEGGLWKFTMHSPDGHDFLNESRFLKINEPDIIILDHTVAPLFQAHFTFTKVPEGCRIGWSMVFNDAQTCKNVAKYARAANEQNIDRLIKIVNGMAA